MRICEQNARKGDPNWVIGSIKWSTLASNDLEWDASDQRKIWYGRRLCDISNKEDYRIKTKTPGNDPD